MEREPENGPMIPLVLSFVAPLVDAEHSDGDPAKVYIVIPRHRAYVADLLRKALEAREDVEIIVDRRHGERRTRHRPVAVERRRADRRRPKEEVIEVVIGKLDQLGRPPESPA
jgi:hypothetical protein